MLFRSLAIEASSGLPTPHTGTSRGRSVGALRHESTGVSSEIRPDGRTRETPDRVSGGEARLEHRVGSTGEYERCVNARGTPVVDETGEVVRAAGPATDPDAQRITRRTLRTDRGRVRR